MNNLITALHKILGGKDVQTSGNLENRLREADPKQVKKIADGYVSNTGIKSWEAFELGLDLGREVREKTVYRVSIDQDHYFFVGTEADITRKIDAELGLAGGEDGEVPEETIDMLEQEIRKA